jgi:sulfate/thiosulfate transport system permease protein
MKVLPIYRSSISTSSLKVQRRGRTILIIIALGYAGFLLVAPLAALLYGAFQQGIKPLAETFRHQDVQMAFLRTVWICIIVALFHAIFGTIIAWVLVRHRFKGKNLLNSLIDLPFAFSPVVVGYMLLLLFGRNGMLFPVFSALNIQIAFALPGMVLATLIVTLPFMIRELVPVMEALDIQQERAAATLGARNWQIFFKITLPYLRWGLLYGLMLTFARALGEFGAILVIGGGIQGRTETATIFISRALDERQYAAAYSAALMLGIMSLILVFGTEWIKHRWKDKAGRGSAAT